MPTWGEDEFGNNPFGSTEETLEVISIDQALSDFSAFRMKLAQSDVALTDADKKLKAAQVEFDAAASADKVAVSDFVAAGASVIAAVQAEIDKRQTAA